MSESIDLFLSHNGKDKPWTERLAIAVEADRAGAPLRVFFDEWDIEPGELIPAELENALQRSRHVGLVLSPEALASDWVTLERSTTIYRDPRARARTLIPLLRRDCTPPDMLAMLAHIDFRRDQDFDAGLERLIRVIRGLPTSRRTAGDVSDFHFREDANMLRQQRKVFERPAFRVSCIWELFIKELLEAIDGTAAAINTGSLYSRDHNLLATFPDQNQYRLPEFKEAFSKITNMLTALKRAVIMFESFFSKANPGYDHHQNFYAMLMDVPDKVNPRDTRTLVNYMDSIDQIRNDILGELNVLLVRCGEPTFPPIELSSQVIKMGRIGGADRIAPLLG